MQRLPDQSVLGGYRSAIFLFRQPFLLVPGLLGTVVVAAGLLQMMFANGHRAPGDVVTMLLIAPLTGFGFAVMGGLPAFFVARALTPRPAPFATREGEALTAEVPANHFLRHEGRGGRLFVTDRRVVFAPHRFNVQRAPVEQRLADVRDVRWGRIVSLYGNTLSCFLELVEDGRSERYVVTDAAGLGERIEAAAAAARAANR